MKSSSKLVDVGRARGARPVGKKPITNTDHFGTSRPLVSGRELTALNTKFCACLPVNVPSKHHQSTCEHSIETTA